MIPHLRKHTAAHTAAWVLFALTAAASVACDGGSSPSKAYEGPELARVSVADCDRYIAQQRSCIEKQPDKRAERMEALAKKAASWKALAESPATAPGLSEMCERELELAAPSLEALGCM